MACHFEPPRVRRADERRLLLCWTPALVITLTLFQPAHVAAEKTRRVRDLGDTQIAQLIEEGIRLSPTFRSLAETVDATNGIESMSITGRFEKAEAVRVGMRIEDELRSKK